MPQPLTLLMAPDQSQRLEALLHRVTSVELDTLLSFDELFVLTGLHRGNKLYALIDRANKELFSTTTMLVNVRGQGYRKATAHQQMAHADGRRLRGTRQLRKAVVELVHTDEKQLRPEEITMLHQMKQLAVMRYHAATRKRLEAQQMDQRATRTQAQAMEDMTNVAEALLTQLKHFGRVK
jgi:hypothetical protein